MPNNLTMTSPVYDTAAQKFGTAALSGGTGVSASAVVPSVYPFTFECWAKHSASPSSIEVAAGQADLGWLGISANGNAEAAYGKTTTVFLTTSISIKDGAWHHLALVMTATGGTFYVDGQAAASSTTTLVASGAASGTTLGIRNYAAGFTWSGEVDEVAVFSSARYSAAFTPPSTAYTGTEPNLVSLYHLDSSGVDSGTSNATILPNNPGIVYSPYNWLATAAQAQTINGGAYFKTLFSGSSIALNFTLGTAPYPEAYAFIDGQQVWEGTLTATLSLTIPAAYSSWPHHLLYFVIKGTTCNQDRWNAQVTAAVLTSITLAPGSSVTAPVLAPRTLLFFGDSITEGCWTVSHPSSPTDDVDYYDATLGWAYQQAALLGAEVGVVGFSLQGFVKAGQGNVPAFISTYNYLWSGQPRVFTPAPDAVIVNMGTNDTSGNGVSDASVVTNATTALNGILAATPSTTKLIVMRPFNGQAWADIQQAVTAVSSSRVSLLDTSGFQNTVDSSDGLHPLGVANFGTIAPKVAGVLQPLLMPLGKSYIFS